MLALAEVKETWDAVPPYDRYDYYGEVEHFDDCEDEECGVSASSTPTASPEPSAAAAVTSPTTSSTT
ncbi:hypothetical protein [Streptomyces sp. I6]|uniref:hypothetical protein n=1 Tax=Streptomyces sp. I6 TaxID=2483113 RepID=UPI0028800E21|nr:hypothetical protein [Streptomyces sp. I6]